MYESSNKIRARLLHRLDVILYQKRVLTKKRKLSFFHAKLNSNTNRSIQGKESYREIIITELSQLDYRTNVRHVISGSKEKVMHTQLKTIVKFKHYLTPSM